MIILGGTREGRVFYNKMELSVAKGEPTAVVPEPLFVSYGPQINVKNNTRDIFLTYHECS